MNQLRLATVMSQLKVTNLRMYEVMSAVADLCDNLGTNWFVLDNGRLQHTGETYPEAFNVLKNEYETYGRIMNHINS